HHRGADDRVRDAAAALAERRLPLGQEVDVYRADALDEDRADDDRQDGHGEEGGNRRHRLDRQVDAPAAAEVAAAAQQCVRLGAHCLATATVPRWTMTRAITLTMIAKTSRIAPR